MFDKTGTLTEDGLDLKWVLPVNGTDTESLSFDDPIKDVEEFPKRSQLLEAMASFHSITRIHGELASYSLDCKMFEFTNWELTEPNSEETYNYDKLSPPTVRPKFSRNRHEIELGTSYEIGIIRQFPFSSSSQRMYVTAFF